MTTMKDEILKAVARNLQEFGYPDAAADNVSKTKLFAMFGKSMVEEFQDKHEGNLQVSNVCGEILAEMEEAIADG